VRELAHSIERAVLMAAPAAVSIRARDLALPPAGTGVAAADLSLEETERLCIEKAFARHNGDVRAASRQLGMSRSALYRRLQSYGIRG
jgi:transcriptional regulator of acetoin/glycerol metabolism